MLDFVAVLVYTVAMKFDYKSVYEKNAAFYERHPIAKKVLLFSNLALTGVFFLAYFALVIYAAVALETKDIIKILAIPALCVALVTLLRILFARPRPYSQAGANITPILHKKSRDKESFPSRHLACAFVIAAVFFSYLTGAGICLTVLGCVLGYVRFALGVHYPTDLLGGAALGGICGLLLLI